MQMASWVQNQHVAFTQPSSELLLQRIMDACRAIRHEFEQQYLTSNTAHFRLLEEAIKTLLLKIGYVHAVG
jgi:hypothetical protein